MGTTDKMQGSKSKFKVDFIGIGVPRCGTTWISQCLAEHPQVCFSSRKEPDFFLNTHYHKGLKFYQSFFKNCKGEIKGEYSPSYYLHEEVARRIKKHFPDVKLLTCLRNPIERTLSHYRFKIRTGQEVEPTISKELASKRFYKIYGFYHQHLNRFLKHFNRKNILILIYEDILTDPTKFIKSVYKFLKIDDNFIPKVLRKKFNITQKRRKLDKVTRENLRELFKDDIKNLENLIERNLSFWK